MRFIPVKLWAAGGGAVSITAATAAGQAITLLLLPILSRLYTPSDFGVLSLALSVSAMLAPIAVLRFDNAVLLPPGEFETRSVALAALMSSICFGLVAGILLVLFPLPGDDTTRGSWIDYALIGLLVTSSGLLLVLRQLSLRQKKFQVVAGTSIVQSASISGVQLLFGHVRLTATNGLIFGNALGTLAAVGMLVPSTKQYFRWTSWQAIVATVRRYWRFPVVFGPSTFLVLFAQQAPLLFVIFWYGAEAGGQMGMADRIVAVPLALLGTSIGQVFGAQLSDRIRGRRGGFRRLYLKTSLFLSVIGILSLVFFMFVATWAVPVLLGEAWHQAGQFAQAMAVSAGIRMVVNPTRRFIALFERAHLSVVLEFVRIGLLVLAVIIGIWNNASPVGMVWYMFIALAIADVITWVIGVRITSIEDSRLAAFFPGDSGRSSREGTG